MKIQTLSVLCGTAACNARCPFCVSRMTYEGGVGKGPREINFRNFEIACQFAERAGVTTAMLTGKGEPTLWPEQIQHYLMLLHRRFPFIELQTNGLTFARDDERAISDSQLREWWLAGLTTICLSVVHWEEEANRQIYTPHRPLYSWLIMAIHRLHEIGFSVRLNCILIRGLVDSWTAVEGLIAFAQKEEVEQLTFMPVNSAGRSRDDERQEWARKHQLTKHSLLDIESHLENEGNPLMDLAHGARVFDYQGQNVCLSNCLSKETYTDKSVMRNLIFFPDGHLRYDWEYQGAILL